MQSAQQLRQISASASTTNTDRTVAYIVGQCIEAAKNGGYSTYIQGSFVDDVHQALNKLGYTVKTIPGQYGCSCDFGCSNCATHTSISWK